MTWFDTIPLSKRGSIHANKSENANGQRVSGQMPTWCPGAESDVSHIYTLTLQTARPQHKMLRGFIRDEHSEQFLLFNAEHRLIFPRCTVLQFLNVWSIMLLRSPNRYYTSWSTTVLEMCLSLHLLRSEEIRKDLRASWTSMLNTNESVNRCFYELWLTGYIYYRFSLPKSHSKS